MVWLNLVCLDAPIVALAWQSLFASAFNLPIDRGNSSALFLTAWLIYLADRLADASALPPAAPRSLRQKFCLGHRRVWLFALAAVAAVDACVISLSVAPKTVLAGACVGLLALIYLILNHPLGRIWKSLPLKEVAIGFLFTAGTLVALLPSIPRPSLVFVLSSAAFASVCVLNCVTIAWLECELDQAQRKVSIATRYPSQVCHLKKTCLLFALAALVLGIACPSGAQIFACVSVSSLLLAWLNGSSLLLGFDDDKRTALADLVLLTPVIALLISNA
ncbi:MAG: hypothetical protein ABJB09_02455 [Verrucomicrobiota bacterium]